MTQRQNDIMDIVRRRLDNVRPLLDDVMYRTDLLDDSEYRRIRGIYDDLCGLIDRI